MWALCVLQQVQEAELQAVLRPELHTQFLGEQWAVLPPLSDADPRASPPPPRPPLGACLVLRASIGRGEVVS